MRAGAMLAATTWMRVGGPAEVLARPADRADLLLLLAALPEDVKLTVLGAGSNVIVRDGGIEGVTLRLGGGFNTIVVEEDGIVAGAACLDAEVAARAEAACLGGLEFLGGIPGSVGGAVAMNAGAYGGEIAQCLDWAEIATAEGVMRLSGAELRLSYRHAALPPRGVVIRARLRARRGAAALIAERGRAIEASRTSTQPIRARTGGSTFRNPAPHESDWRAWELIDAAGCRGLSRGDAQVSALHCNFLINAGAARASELESLGEEVRRRVAATSGIWLQWEIRRLGEAAATAELAVEA